MEYDNQTRVRDTTYRFGSYRFDARERLLYRADERVALTPKAADLLLVLLEREGQLLTKDELLHVVWPDTFVEEANLTKHIFFLRKTLGEDGQQGAYIETIPKRGYRFVGPVQRGATETQVAVIEEGSREHIIIEETADSTPVSRRTWLSILALASLLILAAGVLTYASRARIASGPQLHSLVVLPFANLGQNADNDYFSDGLTEELIAAFSSVRGLRVIPRTTAFQFKGKSGDLRSIGRQLEAEAVLDGGVQRDGGRLRIRLALTRVADGQTIWSQTYDRGTQDALVTQDEIANSVIHALFPNDQRSTPVLAPSGTKNVEAQNLYLQANFIRQKFGGSLDEALVLFQQAARLDPEYAQAWAGQAFCYTELGYGFIRYPKDVFPLAVQAVQHALQLNPRLALAHAISGNINLVYLRDWAAAHRELKMAISLDPNDGESHHWMSHYWVSLGRFKEAKDESRRALASDPLNFSIGSHQAWVELETGDYAQAIREAESILRLDPLHGPTSWYQLRAYELSGQLKEAIRIRRRTGSKKPPPDDLAAGLHSQGSTGYWRLDVDAKEANRKVKPTSPIRLAESYACLGDKDRTLFWLEKAVEERDAWAVYLKVEPLFRGLRDDPRFQKIIKDAGIP